MLGIRGRKTERVERQELHCHGCNRYVQFDLNFEFDGNHVLLCPSCGHEHCRVVKDGKITGDRWDSRNGQTYIITGGTATTSSTYSTYTSTDTSTGGTFLYQSWMNTGTGC